MHEDRLDERLSDEELELFTQYLHRFANYDVDVFLNLVVGSREHPVYVNFCRAPSPLWDVSDYMRPFADRQPPTSNTDINDAG
ncbi:hypothetical protein ACWGLE_24120 [Streptomyces sp. NPDC055897]